MRVKKYKTPSGRLTTNFDVVQNIRDKAPSWDKVLHQAEMRLVRKKQQEAQREAQKTEDAGYLDGVTVTPKGVRNTTWNDWEQANRQERAEDEQKRIVQQTQQFTNNIRNTTGEFAQDYLMPFMTSIAFPGAIIPGLAGWAGTEMTNNIIKGASKNKYDTWGEMMSDLTDTKSQFGRTAWEFTNPGMLLASLAGSPGSKVKSPKSTKVKVSPNKGRIIEEVPIEDVLDGPLTERTPYSFTDRSSYAKDILNKLIEDVKYEGPLSRHLLRTGIIDASKPSEVLPQLEKLTEYFVNPQDFFTILDLDEKAKYAKLFSRDHRGFNLDAIKQHADRLADAGGASNDIRKAIATARTIDEIASNAYKIPEFTLRGRRMDAKEILNSIYNQLSGGYNNPNKEFLTWFENNFDNAYAYTDQKYMYVPLSYGNKFSTIASHELAHLEDLPIGISKVAIKPIEDKSWAKAFNFSKLSNELQEYFSPTEVAARGTQIKDWLGLVDRNSKITTSALKRAAKEYPLHHDNNMSTLFGSIKDWNAAAEWLTKYSKMWVPGLALAGGAALYNPQDNSQISY